MASLARRSEPYSGFNVICVNIIMWHNHMSTYIYIFRLQVTWKTMIRPAMRSLRNMR